MIPLTLVTASALALPSASAQWTTLQASDPHIECTTDGGKDGGKPWCRSTGTVALPLEQVSDTLEHMAKYQKLFESIVRIDVVTPETMHVVLDFPAPLSDRDYVAKYTLLTEGDARIYRWEPVPETKVPAEDGLVRLPDMAGEWRLVSDGSGTKVTYLWEGDVLGSLPGWMLDKAHKIAGQQALADIGKAAAAATHQ